VRHGQYRSRSRSRSHDDPSRELLHPRHRDKARRPGSASGTSAFASTQTSLPPHTFQPDNTSTSPPPNNRSRRSRRDHRSTSRVRAADLDRDLGDHGSPAPAPTTSERPSPHHNHHDHRHHHHKSHHHHPRHRSRSRSHSPSRHHRSHPSRHHIRSPAPSSGISHRNTEQGHRDLRNHHTSAWLRGVRTHRTPNPIVAADRIRTSPTTALTREK
jgi:hypothetical protein